MSTFRAQFSLVSEGRAGDAVASTQMPTRITTTAASVADRRDAARLPDVHPPPASTPAARPNTVRQDRSTNATIIPVEVPLELGVWATWTEMVASRGAWKPAQGTGS
jgi:hypothetical protein